MNNQLKYNFFKKNHLFHLVDSSYIPMFLSFSLFLLICTMIDILFSTVKPINTFFFLILVLTLFINMWFYRIFVEYSDRSIINVEVEKNFILGMLLFVCSEICLFGSVFWAFFHASLAPSIFIGAVWPPVGIESLNPFTIPLVNTLLLLTSGATANNFYYLLRHMTIRHELTFNTYSYSFNTRWYVLYGSLLTTVLLGLLFILIQVFEYLNSPFSISDSIFGSTFFMSTGLHGLHVFLGLTVLIFILFRLISGDFDSTQHHTISTTCALIYWHFVDVVWLFLFTFVYVWGA